MANTPATLLAHLDAIAAQLERRPEALALIGLGSVGLELERLDAHSDIDFFVIVEPGAKRDFLDDLSWLAAPEDIAYTFKNTADGEKTLLSDGTFCEWAVFEPEELRTVPFAPGRIIWKRTEVPGDIAEPHVEPGAGEPRRLEWLLGEALTNLYVGLGRELRGEKLTAMRFIQGYALDRVVELAAFTEKPAAALSDRFAPERRFERRYPGVAAHLPDLAQGYARNVESARATLAYLTARFNVNAAMRDAILELCDAAGGPSA